MHGDRAGFWNRAHMYPALGFERFVSKKDYEVDEVFGLGLSDGSFFRQSLAMLEAQERPFYAFLVTLSSHYPFGFPELLKPRPSTRVTRRRARYCAAILRLSIISTASSANS